MEAEETGAASPAPWLSGGPELCRARRLARGAATADEAGGERHQYGPCCQMLPGWSSHLVDSVYPPLTRAQRFMDTYGIGGNRVLCQMPWRVVRLGDRVRVPPLSAFGR